MPLRDFLSNTWEHIQANLFPWLTEELGPLTDLHKQVITTLELACVEKFVRSWPGLPGGRRMTERGWHGRLSPKP